jgi:hypothetical protein
MDISAISAAFPTLIEPLEKASIAAATLTPLSDKNSGTNLNYFCQGTQPRILLDRARQI